MCFPSNRQLAAGRLRNRLLYGRALAIEQCVLLLLLDSNQNVR